MNVTKYIQFEGEARFHNIAKITRIVKSRKLTLLRSPRDEHSLGSYRRTTKNIELKIEEGSRDVQLKEGGGGGASK